MPNIDDALAFTVDFIRAPRTDDHSTHGYELYLPVVLFAYAQEVENVTAHPIYNSPRVQELSPVFYEAAWELCRRGVLRPGVRHLGGQTTDVGAGGSGYSVTNAGRKWIEEGADSILVYQRGRLNHLFAQLSDRLGSGFLQRAQEAVHCHSSGAYLACCALCGAAAESIVLAIAVAKSGDEDATLRQYRAANGRGRVINSIIGQASAHISEPFLNATGLLNYWRDEAAHGTASTISEIEAHEALARLIRFAQFVNDNWDELT